MNIDDATLGATVTAIGALGLAACALVDTSKTLPGGGVSNVGFDCIEAAVNLFFPKAPDAPKVPNLAGSFLYTLHANWISGMAAADQKAVAKSLIKLRLTPDTSRQFAAVTQVDPAVLEEVARRMTIGAALEAQHTNALGRFDLALTAILDAAYQRADQRYRNFSRGWAMIAAIVLAGLGGIAISNTATQWLLTVFCGVLAVPLAPITKDLTSALTAGVKMAQSLKR